MKNKRSNEAVSEIVGIILLLSITISLFVLICNIVLSFPSSSASPSTNLVGTIEESWYNESTGKFEDIPTLLIEHWGGEEINLDTKILIKIDGKKIPFDGETPRIRDFLDNEAKKDNAWGIGEWLIYQNPSIEGSKQVSVIIVDVESDSVIMTGIFQGT